MKIRYLAAALAILTLSACTDEGEARRAAENVGLKNVQITGYRLFRCSEDDLWHTGFRAVNPQGKTVTGTVCSGVFKGATVRFD